MLNANAADHAKLLRQVTRLLEFYAFVEVENDKGDVEDGIIPHVYVSTRKFYEACQLSGLQRRFFNEEVNDVLTGTAFCRKFGIWVFAEVGDGYSVFVYLGPHLGRAGVDAVIEEQSKDGKAVLATFEAQKASKPKTAFTSSPDDEDEDAWDDDEGPTPTAMKKIAVKTKRGSKRSVPVRTKAEDAADGTDNKTKAEADDPGVKGMC